MTLGSAKPHGKYEVLSNRYVPSVGVAVGIHNVSASFPSMFHVFSLVALFLHFTSTLYESLPSHDL